MTGERDFRMPERPHRRTGMTSLALLAILALGACAQPRDAVPLGGTLSVLGPDQALVEAVSQGEVAPGWEISGEMPPGALAIHQIDKYRALGVTAGATPFALLRRTHASLLATPYLSWAWHTDQVARSGSHPVRILVVLVDRDRKAERSWWQFGGGNVTRVIQMVWNASALGRGSVVGPRVEAGRPESARYIARGGPEQGNRWRFDTVDLALIHRQVWPGDDPSKMDIRYIGVAAQASTSPASIPATMNVAAIRLMR